jgi:hypothetical protein
MIEIQYYAYRSDRFLQHNNVIAAEEWKRKKIEAGKTEIADNTKRVQQHLTPCALSLPHLYNPRTL